MNTVPPHKRDVAMVFQSYALYPHKTVYDNIAFGLRMRKHPKGEIDRRVRDAAQPPGDRAAAAAPARASSRAGSASASRSAAPWCASRPCS